jgi:hypothetical protein
MPTRGSRGGRSGSEQVRDGRRTAPARGERRRFCANWHDIGSSAYALRAAERFLGMGATADSAEKTVVASAGRRWRVSPARGCGTRLCPLIWATALRFPRSQSSRYIPSATRQDFACRRDSERKGIVTCASVLGRVWSAVLSVALGRGGSVHSRSSEPPRVACGRAAAGFPAPPAGSRARCGSGPDRPDRPGPGRSAAPPCLPGSARRSAACPSRPSAGAVCSSCRARPPPRPPRSRARRARGSASP